MSAVMPLVWGPESAYAQSQLRPDDFGILPRHILPLWSVFTLGYEVYEHMK